MILKIKVKTNSKKQEIESIDDESYRISLKSKSEDNKANFELIKLMKRYFRKDVKIIKGLRSKNKIIEVKNANKI